jgi:hypothetical protein
MYLLNYGGVCHAGSAYVVVSADDHPRAEFEVLSAVVMKSSVVWDITLFSPLKVIGRFGGTYLLHFQG